MKRQPVVGEFWEITSERNEHHIVFLDKVVAKWASSPFYARGGELEFAFDHDCFDRSIDCGGEFAGVNMVNRPATKEEIQAWIDKWGVPETFKGQPEYPLEETKKEVNPTPELVDPFTVDWKESDFKGETHAALKPDYMELPGGNRIYWIYDLESVANYGAKTGVLYPLAKEWNEEHNYVAYPGCHCLTYVGHLVPGSKVKEYEAAKAKTQPTPHPVVEAITEDLLAKDFAEAKKKVKEAKERATAIREIIRLEEVIKKSTQLKAELTKKWLPKK